MFKANTLQLISEPSLLNFVTQPDNIELLSHSLVESEREANHRRFGRSGKMAAPKPRYLSEQDQLDSFSTKILDRTRSYFNRHDVPHPAVLFSDNAIKYMNQKYTTQGRQFFWPIGFMTAAGLAQVFGMSNPLVVASLFLGMASAEGSAILRTMALNLVYNLSSLAGAMQEVGAILADYDHKNNIIVFYANPTTDEAHLMLVQAGMHHLQQHSPLLAGLSNDARTMAFREGMVTGYEYSVARQHDDTYQTTWLMNHNELIAGLLVHLVKSRRISFLSLRFGARDVLGRINSPVSLPHALGYGAFFLAEQKHGADIYRKVFDGDVSFLQTT